MNRLQQRVDRLETGKVAKRGPEVLLVDNGDTVEAAKARYIAKHPENPDLTDIIIVEIIDPTI